MSIKAITIFIAGVCIMTFIGACTLSEPEETQHSKSSIMKKPERQSPSIAAEVMNKMTIKEHIEMYWKFFFEKGEKTPTVPLPQQQVELDKLFDGKNTDLKVSWLGHSCLLMNIDGYSILTDPIFERKVSLIGPARFNENLPVNVQDLPFIDVVIISHDHYDHLNKFSIQQLSGKTGVFMVPLRVGKRLVQWGVPEEKIIELNWWDEFQTNSNLTIAATPAQHFSGRGLFDRNSTLWASWVIKTPKHRVYFSGDSGYFGGFKEIGDKYGPFDMTFLECGAYDTRWSNIHMFPEQTVQAHLDLKGKILQPIHWATFNLALHPWYEPMERLITAAWNREVSVSTPVIGSVIDYNQSRTTNLWWLSAMEKIDKQTASNELVTDFN